MAMLSSPATCSLFGVIEIEARAFRHVRTEQFYVAGMNVHILWFIATVVADGVNVFLRAQCGDPEILDIGNSLQNVGKPYDVRIDLAHGKAQSSTASARMCGASSSLIARSEITSTRVPPSSVEASCSKP